MADEKVSALSAASALDLTELFYAAQAGGPVGVTGAQLQAGVHRAGSASANSWRKMGSGTVLTTPEAGAIEYDGAAIYDTVDTTAGRAQRTGRYLFRLAADGSALGSGIADYFGANSAFPTVANGIYEFNFYCWFLKTTAGTVTWTLTNTQVYTNLVAEVMAGPAAGIATAGTAQSWGIFGTTTAAAALPASASLTTAVNHYHHIRALAEVGTAGNIRLRATESAGTITPRRDSYYTVSRLAPGNVGSFVA